MDELLARYSGNAVPGASIAVIKRGAPVLIHSCGMADLERRCEVRPETSFRLASISKQFTATAVMMLVERHLLDLDDTLSDRMDRFGTIGRNIRLRHLLQHSSGLPDYELLIADDFEGQLTDHDVLQLVTGRGSMYFESGREYRYSNTGYAILALLVEKVSGLPFAEFLRQNIFLPLSMNGTVAYQKAGPEPGHRAFGYTVDKDGVYPSDQSPTSAVLGDGGIYSSVLDYLKWDAALYGERLLSQASLQQMWIANKGDYGFGWRVDTFEGLKRLHHDGDSCGFRNYVIRLPEVQLTVLILTNRGAPDVKPLAERLARQYLA